MEPLFGDRVLREAEIDQHERAFRNSALSGWQREVGSILIPRETRHEFKAAVEQSAAIPYALNNDDEKSSGGVQFFESESARRVRQRNDKAKKLGSTIIASFADIAWASVVYDERDAGGFDNRTIQSASVALVPRNGKPIAPSRISMIQSFVCGAYAGMESDQVTVTDTSARKTYDGSDAPETRQQRQAEYELEQRLTELLSGYRGLRIGARSVPTDSDPAGDDLNDPPSVIAKPNKKETPIGAFQMQVSVGVPESQFHSQWISDYRSRHPGRLMAEAPTAEQLDAVKTKVVESIRDAIRPLVTTSSANHDHAIQVWSYLDTTKPARYSNFDGEATGLAALIATVRSNVAFLLPIGCLLLVATAFGVAAMRMRLRSTEVDSSTRTGESMAAKTDQSSEPKSAVSMTDEATLRDDLAELVETNPELAAQIVHSWIADAA